MRRYATLSVEPVRTSTPGECRLTVAVSFCNLRPFVDKMRTCDRGQYGDRTDRVKTAKATAVARLIDLKIREFTHPPRDESAILKRYSKAKISFPTVSREQILAAVEADDNQGFCLQYGAEAYHVEHATRCICETCGLPEVFGTDELLYRLGDL